MHITLTKNMHMKVFFVCLFLFSKIYLYLKKNANESYETRTEKNAKK